MLGPASPDITRPPNVEAVDKPNITAYTTLMESAKRNYSNPDLSRAFMRREKPGTTTLQRGTSALLHTYISPYLMQSFVQEASQEGRPIRIGDLFKQLAKGASIHNLELTVADIMTVTDGDTAIADTVARLVNNISYSEGLYNLSQRQDTLAIEKLFALQIPSDVLQTVFQKIGTSGEISYLGKILHEVYAVCRPFAQSVVEQLDTESSGNELSSYLLSVLEQGLDREKIKITKPSPWKRLSESIKCLILMRRMGVSFRQQRETRQYFKRFGDEPIFKAPTIYTNPQRYQQAATEFYRRHPQGTRVPQYGVLALTPEQEVYLQGLEAQNKQDLPALRRTLEEINYNWVIAQEVFGGKPHRQPEGEYFN